MAKLQKKKSQHYKIGPDQFDGWRALTELAAKKPLASLMANYFTS
jgi:hypothetical protein